VHRPSRRRFPRRRFYSKGIDDLFQIDLADMSNLSDYNDGYRYLLNCIDVFTKHAWSVLLKAKTGREVSNAFELHVLSKRRCNMVQSDKGTEFLNSTLQSMLRPHSIKYYTSENEDIKAAVVERFNRALKGKCIAISQSNTLDVTSTFYQSFCILPIARITRSIGMAPIQDTPENEDFVRDRLYAAKLKTLRWKFNVGDKVRISMRRLPFQKGYVGNWSVETFLVPVTYILTDLSGEDIQEGQHPLTGQRAPPISGGT